MQALENSSNQSYAYINNDSIVFKINVLLKSQGITVYNLGLTY